MLHLFLLHSAVLPLLLIFCSKHQDDSTPTPKTAHGEKNEGLNNQETTILETNKKKEDVNSKKEKETDEKNKNTEDDKELVHGEKNHQKKEKEHTGGTLKHHDDRTSTLEAEQGVKKTPTFKAKQGEKKEGLKNDENICFGANKKNQGGNKKKEKQFDLKSENTEEEYKEVLPELKSEKTEDDDIRVVNHEKENQKKKERKTVKEEDEDDMDFFDLSKFNRSTWDAESGTWKTEYASKPRNENNKLEVISEGLTEAEERAQKESYLDWCRRERAAWGYWASRRRKEKRMKMRSEGEIVESSTQNSYNDEDVKEKESKKENTNKSKPKKSNTDKTQKSEKA